ncbi:hypothetical protein BH11ARM1_BH11ARM1_06850 [soil metagenome]
MRAKKNGRQVNLNNAHKKGFTLIEMLVATVILGVGVAAVLGAYASISSSEDRARTVEKLQRLAVDKFSEMRATNDTFTANDNGDFSDRGDDNINWSMEVEPSGVENLQAVTITVTQSNAGNTAPEAEVTQLVFVQPPATDTGGTKQ